MLLSEKGISLNAELKAILKQKIDKETLKEVERYSKKVKVTGIRYKSNGHIVNGYIVEPRKVNKKQPCIIFNRGGTGDFGALNLTSVFTMLGQIASWGYIVIASQYSGCAGSEGRDDWGGKNTLNDVLELKNILAKLPRADVKKIGMLGASRGGMMTYLCMSRVKWIKAAATIAGVSDLRRLGKLRPEMKEVFVETFGGKKVDIEKRSAVLFVKNLSKKTPLLMMHGTADIRVSPLDSLDLEREMLKHKLTAKLVLYEGDDHGLTKHEKESAIETKAWFDRFLKKRKPSRRTREGKS